ncbi:uncharacterized protein LOC143453331 isoform X2 [Clavelina lepadiformis]|uniref:uncharacterized protein LOC143453331 isoform X2 n=1 Tax=Clavelina lepadiformis TaxID=159417 RepID=UPI0040411B5A
MTETQIKLYRCDEILCIADDDEGDLGEGAYGKVRLGFHKKFGAVAVKCSEMKGGKREKILLEKKIKKEIGHLQQANHDNIVRVYGWTQWPKAVAIIMEYLPAGNLKAILMDEDVVLGPLLRARFGAEISNGLAFIHNLFDNKRLLHGDIKPENILMTEDLHCKIGDFGAAQLSSYTGSTTTAGYKAKDSVQMTLLYAAPERLQDISTKLTPKYDTYSYGMTLHMILAREMPIDVGTPLETFTDRVIEGQRPSVQSIHEYIQGLGDEGTGEDAAMIRVLNEEMIRCWQQDPADRPTMTEVKDRLQSQLQNRDLSLFHKLVHDASQELCLKKPSFIQKECAPVSRFVPPSFMLGGIGSTSGSEGTSSNESYSISELRAPAEVPVLHAPVETTLAKTQDGSRPVFTTPDEISSNLHVLSLEDSTLDSQNESNTSASLSSSGDVADMKSPSPDSEVTIEQAKSYVRASLVYLRTCNLLNEWNEEEAKTATEKLDFLSRLTSSGLEVRKDVADEMLCNNAIPLFLQYFKMLIDDGKLYPDQRTKVLLLETLKMAIWNLTDPSAAFCVECGKQGLIALIAIHLQHVYTCSWLSTKESTKKEFLCVSAFLLAYVAEEDQMHSLIVHQTLIQYIVQVIGRGIENKRSYTETEGQCYSKETRIHLETSKVSLLEMCEGLAKLARNKENSAALFNAPEFPKYIIAILESEDEMERKCALQLIRNMCLSKKTQEKFKKQTTLVLFFQKMRINDPDKNLRQMADDIYQVLITEESFFSIFKSKK